MQESVPGYASQIGCQFGWMPDMSKGWSLEFFRWTDSPMSSSEITYIIRELLQDAADGLDLRQLGSHSAKVTLFDMGWAIN